MHIEITCPSCHRTIKAKESFAGKKVNCPGCKAPFQVPDASEAEPADEYKLSDLGLDTSPPTPPPSPFDGLPDSEDKQAAAEDSPWTDVQIPATQQPYAAQQYAGNLPDSRAYPALSVVRIVLKVLAGIVAVSWLCMVAFALFGTIAAYMASSEAGNAMIGLSVMYLVSTLLGGAIVCCFLIAASEVIQVILDIQENTLAAARR